MLVALDLLDESLLSGVHKRHVSGANVINNTAHTPNVDPAVVLLIFKHLRSLPKQSTCILDDCPCLMASGNTKVSEDNGAVLASKQDVTRLDVPMNNILGVEIFDGQKQLKDETLYPLVTHHVCRHLLEVDTQISLVGVLIKDAQETLSDKGLSEPADVGVTHSPHNVTLMHLVVEVGAAAESDLLHDEYVMTALVAHLEHYAKAARADLLDDLEVGKTACLLLTQEVMPLQ